MKKKKKWVLVMLEGLEQGSANYGLPSKLRLPTAFINKVLLEHNHDHMFINSEAATAAWLSHCNKNPVTDGV